MAGRGMSLERTGLRTSIVRGRRRIAIGHRVTAVRREHGGVVLDRADGSAVMSGGDARVAVHGNGACVMIGDDAGIVRERALHGS
jgi:murein DD-endopeptidase MepM/ murein hydrolase activator NlpD